MLLVTVYVYRAMKNIFWTTLRSWKTWNSFPVCGSSPASRCTMPCDCDCDNIVDFGCDWWHGTIVVDSRLSHRLDKQLTAYLFSIVCCCLSWPSFAMVEEFVFADKFDLWFTDYFHFFFRTRYYWMQRLLRFSAWCLSRCLPMQLFTGY